MTGRVVQRPSVREDLLEHYVFIGRDNPGAAERFLQAAEETFEKLAEMPNVGRRWESPHKRLQGVRIWRVKGFENWLIFYRPINDGIDVLHVFHGARDIATLLEQLEQKEQ